MRPTDPKITRRSRRRIRGKSRAFNDKYVWWAGRWMERTITYERTVLSDGSVMEFGNESWHEPGVVEAYRRDTEAAR
jgi:hypothetical protein